MNFKFKEKISNNLFFSIIKIFLFFIFVYAVLRAYNLSMTHDEVLTIAFHANVPWKEVFTTWLANNHFLNTIIVKLVLFIAPYNELLLRSSALLGFGMYLIFSWLILKPNLQRHVFTLGILLLSLNPYLLDFFALARGYGLALGLAMGSIYFFIKMLEQPWLKNRILLVLFIILTVLANLAFLNFIFSIVLLFILLGIYFAKKNKVNKLKYYLQKILLPFCIFLLVFGAIIYQPLFGLIENSDLYLGGEHGFWQDTVGSLISASTYNQSYATFLGFSLLILIILIIIIALVLLSFRIYKKQSFSKVNKQLFFYWSLIIINSLIIIFQHSILAMKVPTGRTVLYFIPIFILVFVFLWQSLIELCKKQLAINIIFVILSGLLILHCLFCFNIRYTYEWRYDADSKLMMNDISLLEDGIPAKDKMTIGATWFFQPSLNYYLAKYSLFEKFNFVQREYYFNSDYEYYYLAENDRVLAEQSGLILIKEYEISNSYLYIAPERLEIIKNNL